MTLHFITDLAFLVGLLLIFKPLWRIVKGLLDKKRYNIASYIQSSAGEEGQSKSLFKTTVTKGIGVNEEVDKILKRAHEEYDAIIENTRKDLESIVEDYLDLAAKKIHDQVLNVVQSMRITSADIASDAVKQLVQEYLTHEQHNNTEVNSSISRDLGKKLH